LLRNFHAQKTGICGGFGPGAAPGRAARPSNKYSPSGFVPGRIDYRAAYAPTGKDGIRRNTPTKTALRFLYETQNFVKKLKFSHFFFFFRIYCDKKIRQPFYMIEKHKLVLHWIYFILFAAFLSAQLL
jgi:hypothetical protein